MKSFVITLKNHEYSNVVANRCIASGEQYNIVIEKFNAIHKNNAYATMESYGLNWSWAKNNTQRVKCPNTNLTQFPYTTSDLRTKIGCSMSHYLLWRKCVELDEPILILEHDAVFLRPLPDITFNGICQINNPENATRNGKWWAKQMITRNINGTHEKTWASTANNRDIPDGLAGNSAYLIKPWAAQECIDKFHTLGVWPNDATICKQLFPYLEEYYPFITKVIQTHSTTIDD